MGNYRDGRIAELSELLEKGVQEIFESRTYAEWLAFSAKFSIYSVDNQVLIFRQMPNATYVMGYKGWQGLGRNVKKGEKGIRILAPSIKELKKPNGEKETVIPYYFPVYVFDVSQTDGRAIPTPAAELTQGVSGYSRFLEALVSASPFSVEFKPLGEGMNGYCDFKNGKIVIRAGMGQAQSAKTLIHEIAHAGMHQPVGISGAAKSKGTKELEAESAAFIVCAHFGIDTSAYSFGYIAAWSQFKDASELKASMERIQEQSSELVGRIERHMGASSPELSKDSELTGRIAESIQSNAGAPASEAGGHKSKPRLDFLLAQARARADEYNSRAKGEASQDSQETRARIRARGREGR